MTYSPCGKKVTADGAGVHVDDDPTIPPDRRNFEGFENVKLEGDRISGEIQVPFRHHAICFPDRCRDCGAELEIGSWPFCPHGAIREHDALAHASEAVVLYEHPTKGVRWPGRNDVPMPARYAKDGFERKEYRSVNDLKRIEKTHHVMSERLNYDRNGRAD